MLAQLPVFNNLKKKYNHNCNNCMKMAFYRDFFRLGEDLVCPRVACLNQARLRNTLQ